MNWVSVNGQQLAKGLYLIQSSDPVNPGACHDGINTIYTWISQGVSDIAWRLPTDVESMDDAKAMIGSRMAQHPETPIIAPRGVWESLFRSPEFRLWCARYEDNDQFISDKEALSIDAAATMAEARESIYSKFLEVR